MEFATGELKESTYSEGKASEKNIKMRKKRSKNSLKSIKILLLFILLTAIVIFITQTLYMQNQKWEYKVVYIQPNEFNSRDKEGAFNYNTITPSESNLNILGSQGWEISASYLEMETAFPNFGDTQYVTGIQANVRPQRLVLILKRSMK